MANPAFGVGLILVCVRKPIFAGIAAVTALVFAIVGMLLLLKEKIVTESLSVGYYTWLASFVALAIGSFTMLGRVERVE